MNVFRTIKSNSVQVILWSAILYGLEFRYGRRETSEKRKFWKFGDFCFSRCTEYI